MELTTLSEVAPSKLGARRFQQLLVVAFLVYAVPLRSQLYRLLEIDSTLLREPTPEADYWTWRVVVAPSALQSHPWKTLAAVEYELGEPLNRFVSHFVSKQRPLLANSTNRFLFVSSCGGTQLTDIRTVVTSVCLGLVGKEPSPHLFRSIAVTHALNANGDSDSLISSFASSMATSVDTIRRHYLVRDPVLDARTAQRAIARVLSNSRSKQIRDEPMSTALSHFAARIKSPTPPNRQHLQLGKRFRLFWSAEEAALVLGVQKYGPGAWKEILCDIELKPLLLSRTSADLKDKWRGITRERKRIASRPLITNMDDDDSSLDEEGPELAIEQETDDEKQAS